ncbi:Calx-beta domain-containing protein [Tahibacter sp.]|uniref:Calx-beta domain-containing protein n=1 Tax=Tahibacter sp. TaxID=2056211 RepID=UPI0028C3F0F2|nr:Calx-beta domain-containing protein [Tahibacter sp.]
MLGSVLLAALLTGIGTVTAPLLLERHRPAPATIRFVLPETTTSGTEALLDIELRRDAYIDEAIDVPFETRDASAQEGVDYAAARGFLHFAAGERTQRVSVTLLPDPSHQKGPRHFTLVLPQAKGTPTHRIAIVPPQVSASDAIAAEALALSASRIAKDIADLRLKLQVVEELMTASRDDDGAYAAYRRRLATTSGDLSRARERYLHEMEQLRRLKSGAILDAVDAVAARLDGQGYAQQSKAVRVMKRHLLELMDGRAPEMDRWVEELMRTIPRVESSARNPTTV